MKDAPLAAATMDFARALDPITADAFYIHIG